MTTNEWLHKIDFLEFWSALDDHFSTELLTDEHAEHIRSAIIRCIERPLLQKLQEEYKRGYIDGGMAQLTKQEEEKDV